MATERLSAHITQPTFRLAHHRTRPNTGRMERVLRGAGNLRIIV
jgi:hypothetical protein